MPIAGETTGGESISIDPPASSSEEAFIDEDGFLNIYFSILLVVHVAVLVGIAYFQRPWRLFACCCCSPDAKYRDSSDGGGSGGRGRRRAGSSSRSSSGYDDSNSFDMSTAASVGRRY